MRKCLKLFLLLMFTSSGFAQERDKQSGEVNEFEVPVEYYKLDNGLKVILSRYNCTYRDRRRLLQHRVQD